MCAADDRVHSSRQKPIPLLWKSIIASTKPTEFCCAWRYPCVQVTPPARGYTFVSVNRHYVNFPHRHPSRWEGLASQQPAVLGVVPVVAALAEGRQVQQTRGLGSAVIHVGHGQDHHSRTNQPNHGFEAALRFLYEQRRFG